MNGRKRGSQCDDHCESLNVSVVVKNRRNYVDNRNKYKLTIKQKKAQAKKERLHKVVNNTQNLKVSWREIRALIIIIYVHLSCAHQRPERSHDTC